MYVAFVLWGESVPWETQLGLQHCHRTPNSLKRSHHKVPGVSSVCLGVLQGAKEKLCISRQALIFQIQSSTSSFSTTAAFPNEQLWYSGFCFSPMFLCEKTSESGQSMKMYLCPPS